MPEMFSEDGCHLPAPQSDEETRHLKDIAARLSEFEARRDDLVRAEQFEALRNPFPGLDVDALLERVNEVAGIDRGELCAVLARLVEDGRLGVEKQYGAEDSRDINLMRSPRQPVPGATHVRFVSDWRPIQSDIGNGD